MTATAEFKPDTLPYVDRWGYGETERLDAVMDVDGILDLGEGMDIIVEDLSRQSWAKSMRGWLRHNGTVIGMMRVMRYTDSTDQRWRVCDVEVRPEFRSRGYSAYLYGGMRAYLGTDLRTAGHYTPEGFERLRGKATLVVDDYDSHSDKVMFNSMNFVRDWDNYIVS